MSKLRRPFLSNRYFFITVRLLRRRAKLTESDFPRLARAFNRARAMHPFYLTACVFLPDHGHAICAPAYPVTVSLAMKSVKQSSMSAINRCRSAEGELWQPRFFAGGAYVPMIFVGMYATPGRNALVSMLKHYYGLNHSHFITNRTYRRAPKTC